MTENFTLSLTEEAPLPITQTELDRYEIAIKARASMMTESIIDIGNMLLDVKERLEHGRFSEWLAERVKFSQSTANNFMRIAREMDSAPLPGTIMSLPYTKVLALLDVPPEQREEFAAEHDVASLTTREIQRLTKELNESKTAHANAENEAQKLREVLAHNEDVQSAVPPEAYKAFEDAYYAEAEKHRQTAEELEALRNTAPEVVVEERTEFVTMPPEDYEEIKAALVRERARAEEAEKYALEKEASEREARSMLRAQKEARNPGNGEAFTPALLGEAVKAFMGDAAMAPHLAHVYRGAEPEDLARYRQCVDTVGQWVEDMRRVISAVGQVVDVDAGGQVV